MSYLAPQCVRWNRIVRARVVDRGRHQLAISMVLRLPRAKYSRVTLPAIRLLAGSAQVITASSKPGTSRPSYIAHRTNV